MRTGEPDEEDADHTGAAGSGRPEALGPVPRRTARWLLVATAPVMGMLVLDQTAVSVALPGIANELGAELSDLQWVLSAFAIGMVTALPLGGSLGDRFGRRRMVLTGLAVFATSSAAASFAPDVLWLILARVPQALGAAMMVPNAIAMLSLAYPPERQGRAIATWTGLAFIGLIAGPLVGGAVTDAVGWRGVFWFAPPLALLSGTAILRLAPAIRPGRSAQPFDVAGTITASIALLLLTYTLIESGRTGWQQPQLLLTGVLGLIALAGFLAIERRVAAPMLDLRVFGNGAMAVTIVVATLVTSVMNTAFFFLSLYLQSVQRYSAGRAGLILVAFTASVVITSLVSGRFLDRFGVRRPMLTGLAALSTAMIAMAGLMHSERFGALFLTMLVLGGCGIGVLQASETTGVMLLAPKGRSSVASAILSTGRQLGSIVGIAVLGTVSELYIQRRAISELDQLVGASDAQQVASEAAAGRVVDLRGLVEPETVSQVQSIITTAQSSGYGLVLLVAGLVLASAWLLTQRRLGYPAVDGKEPA